MNENTSNLQSRFYLNAAKFHYKQMELVFQHRTKFLYYLLAFLSIARSVTLVFKKEFKHDESVMEWYNSKVQEWENNKAMQFFKKLRNTSVHKHTPDTRTRSSVSWGIDVIFSDKDAKKVVDLKGKKYWITPPLPLEGKDRKIIGYAFLHNFKWFEKSPDVIALCKEYLNELEKFVTKAEKMIEKKE